MFYIDEKNCIHITRGDSCSIGTKIFVDVNDNGVRDEEDHPEFLSEYGRIIFTVKTKNSGNVKIKKILSQSDYQDGEYVFDIYPSETMIAADIYEYSFLYMPDKEDVHRAYTYAQGDFEIMHSVTTIDDLEAIS